MMLATALALLLATAPADPLEEARAAFAAGDYPRAEALAHAAARSSGGAAASYLAGLAAFRAGRHAEALEALDAGRLGADSEAAWRFNRGACLAALDRPAEAEAQFLAAADDVAFAPLALVEAGWAALAAGEPGRAAAHAARARRVAVAGAAELVADLEEALAPARPAAATSSGPGPAAPAPPAGSSAAAGASLLRWSGGLRLDGGHDGDALHGGTSTLERRGASATSAPSAFAAASGWVTARRPLGPLTLEAGYAFGQLAYAASAAKDQSVQQHDLSLALRGSPAAGLELEAGLHGGVAFAGLEDFRPLQGSAGGRLAAGLATGAVATTLGEAGLTYRRGQGSEFGYLDGWRLEAGLAEQGRWERLTLRGGYRFALERAGDLSAAVGTRPPSPLCPLGCTVLEVEPLSYAGHAGWATARLEATPWLRLDLDGSLERRGYLDDAVTRLVTELSSRNVNARRLEERRWALGAGATARLSPAWALALRWSWQGSATSASSATPLHGGCLPGEPGCGPAPLGGSSWDRQVAQLGVLGAW